MKKRIVTEENAMTAKLLPLDLQMFASDGQDDNPDDDDPNDDSDDDDDDQSDDDSAGEDEKKFSQRDMTATAAREKKQGRRSAFRDLGFKSEKEAREFVQKHRELDDQQMTPEQKKAAEAEKNDLQRTEAEARAEAAENKLLALELGVKKDSIEDILAIANVKVTDDKDLEDVLTEMKEDKRYRGFFEDSSDGTGDDITHKSKQKKAQNIGKRLAESQAKNNVGKSSYFRK